LFSYKLHNIGNNKSTKRWQQLVSDLCCATFAEYTSRSIIYILAYIYRVLLFITYDNKLSTYPEPRTQPAAPRTRSRPTPESRIAHRPNQQPRARAPDLTPESRIAVAKNNPRHDCTTVPGPSL
jgi:hypothetical protein